MATAAIDSRAVRNAVIEAMFEDAFEQRSGLTGFRHMNVPSAGGLGQGSDIVHFVGVSPAA